MTKAADDPKPSGSPDPDPTLVRGEEAAQTSSSDEKLQRLRARPPLTENRYQFDGEVGRGGMGAVLRVRDIDLGRNLAMKVILGSEGKGSGGTPTVDPQLLQRFLDEAQITGQLDHPGVVPVHELGIDSAGRVYFTMRLVRGVTADEVFLAAREGRDGWTQTRALEVVLKVCDTMAFAHKKGVLHRDLKPGNVMVGKFGEVYVMDWGLAKVLGQDDRRDLRVRPQSTAISRVLTDRSKDEADSDSPLLTMDGAVVGTPCYMSPEQAEGRVELLDQRGDVYAVGAMLYELLAGRQPYVSPGARVSPYSILAAVQAGPPKAIHTIDKTVPAELVAVCDKAMARELERRYRDVRELADDLRAFLEKRVVKAYRTGAVAEMAMWVRRNRGLAAAAAAAVVSLVAGVVSTSVFAWRAAERSTQVAALNTAQRTQLTAASWAAFNQAHRLFAGADAQVSDLGTKQRNTREGLLLLARAVKFDPSNRVAWERFAWECSARQKHLRRMETLTFHHESALQVAAFSADGSRVLTASVDGKARLWSLDNGQLLRSFAHEDFLWRAAISPDGDHVVTSGSEATKVWSLGTGRLLRSIESKAGDWFALSSDGTRLLTTGHHGPTTLHDAGTGALLFSHEHYRELTRPAFSPDGTRVVTPSVSKAANLWDVRTGTLLFTLPHEGNVRSAVFSPDGASVLTWGDATQARLWDVASGKLLLEPAHRKRVTSGSFSPDGSCIVTTSQDGTAILRSLPGGDLKLSLEHQRQVGAAMFSPDGTRVMTSSWDDDPVKMWDVQDGRKLWSIQSQGRRIGSSLFSPDGACVITRGDDHAVRVWEARTGELTGSLEHEGEVGEVEVSPDGARIVTASLDKTAKVWTLGGGKPYLSIEREGGINQCDFSPNGKHVATAGHEGTANIWDADTGELLRSLAHGGELQRACFSPDGTRLVTASADGATKLWDVASGKFLSSVEHRGQLLHAGFGPDGACIVVSGSPGGASLWDGGTGHLLTDLQHQGGVYSSAFCTEGTRLVTAGHAGTVKVWSVDTHVCLCTIDSREAYCSLGPDGAMLAVFKKAIEEPVIVFDATTGKRLAVIEMPAGAGAAQEVVFSPDGAHLVTISSDEVARVWNARTGALLVLLANEGEFDGVSFSPDGRRVLTTSWNQPARMWDAGTGKLLLTLDHDHGVGAAVFSADGCRVATVSDDKSVRLWDLTLPLGLGLSATPAEVDTATVLAELLTGQTMSANGEFATMAAEHAQQLQATLQRVLDVPGPLTPLARWLTSHGPSAPAHPGAAITCTERADIIIDQGGAAGVREAYDLDPGHALIHIALATDHDYHAPDGTVEGGAGPPARTVRPFLRDYDLKRLPADAIVCARAADMLLKQGDKPRALTAAAKALAVDPTNATALRVQAAANR